ncbi:MAG: peptidylprolyl isomerase [Acidobacteriaceae bacterium]
MQSRRDGAQQRLSCLPAAFLVTALAWGCVDAQSSQTKVPLAASKPSVAQSDSPASRIVLPKLPAMPAVKGMEVDRVVAIVNGDLILDSDVDLERRFTALLPYGESSGAFDRNAAIERLINRDLILQQMQLQQGDEITQQAADRDLEELRKSIPICKQYRCETKEGWDRFLATEGFTEESLINLWRQRMEVLAFIELRFRTGIMISQAQIRQYYEQTMLPQYAALKVAPAPLKDVAPRIQQVLLEQQVSKLLDDWLNSLRAQGNVVVLDRSGTGQPIRSVEEAP